VVVVRQIFVIFMLCFFTVSPGQSEEGNSIDEINFVATNWPPFTIGEREPFRGIDIDIAKVIAQKLGLKLNIKYCPFKRCLMDMAVGAYDLQSGIAFNEKRAKYLEYIQVPYGDVSVAFYINKNSAVALNSYGDLYHLTIGSVYASHYFEPFNSDVKIKKQEVYKESLLVPMLRNGRFDAMIGTSPNLEYEILNAGLKGFFKKASFSPEGKVLLYFAISKKSPLLHFKTQITDLIKELVESGQVQEFMSAYR
jgi:polar amino acid transport system substrate-binding protein